LGGGLKKFFPERTFLGNSGGPGKNISLGERGPHPRVVFFPPLFSGGAGGAGNI